MRLPAAVAVVLVVGMAAGVPATPAGTGVISGALVAADTGRPVRRAFVSLTTSPVVTTVISDEQGLFSFPGLPAGLYMLSASKTGYLSAKYGELTPGRGRAGTAITLADGQRVEQLTFPIARAGVITGTLTDDLGDPALTTSVRALRYVMQNGKRTLLLAGSAQADDRGVYRIAALPPGDYIVAASPVRSLSAFLPPDLYHATAYVPVYFPGTPNFSAASTVPLGVSEERSGVDLQLQMVPMARVSGVVLDVDTSVPRAEVDLVAVGAGGVVTSAGLPSLNTMLGPDGRFSFDEVAPGQYSLFVHSRQSASSASLDVRWAMQEVSVNGADVTGVTLTLQRGLTASGVVVFDGPSPPAVSSRMGVMFMPVGESHGLAELGGPELAQVNEDKRFTAPDLVPGRYRLAATPLPDGWMLASAMFGGRDALDSPLELKPGEPPPSGVLTVTPRGTEVSGTLLDRLGAPTGAFTVIVFAADERYWTPDSRRIVARRPPASGQFSFRNLPPGNYRLAAATDVEPGEWLDPVLLRELSAGAIPLSIGDGEKKTQDVRVK